MMEIQKEKCTLTMMFREQSILPFDDIVVTPETPVMSVVSKPFLKWAGGKHKLSQVIGQKLGNTGKRLVEPFVGSGAIFMGTHFKDYLLCDTNNDLIDLYHNIQRQPDELIKAAIAIFDKSNNTEKRFYELRDEFNSLSVNSIKKSALFMYLNRHAFNGLCRYNSKGKYNVPYGNYKSTNPPINAMRMFAEKAKHATFKCCDFKDTFNELREGDIVYCDPPYAPLSITASFTSYHIGAFGDKEQKELAHLAMQAKKAGFTVVISNTDIDYTRKIYKDAVIHPISVRRSISGNAESRGMASEIIAVFSPVKK